MLGRRQGKDSGRCGEVDESGWSKQATTKVTHAPLAQNLLARSTGANPKGTSILALPSNTSVTERSLPPPPTHATTRRAARYRPRSQIQMISIGRKWCGAKPKCTLSSYCSYMSTCLQLAAHGVARRGAESNANSRRMC
jgi:hypothetical protein